MPAGSSPKRERQYEHIKDSAQERGESEGRAKEIAARTVNKERARSGESKTASRSSTKDMSSGERGGQRSGNRSGSHGPTRDQLYNEAKQRGIEGRSNMNKDELQRALDSKKG
ncbi:plasmid stabilization protein [Streptomyces dangxiongensis]|uniref:Plasmid stabilization protein n=1 Tax=Streptomyces dangxiongensis TaxID=1442032 RepID=A0A3G2J863_9ACTN|nr:plasmid stabilization protein [Streptomyces dangxiongensis]AYN38436.1 plasmid stabilization protein [Streptomyces dangxiongensis]